MIHSRGRAVVLLEILTVLFLVAIGGTIMSVGIAAVVRTHRRTADLTNRYAVLNDFLRCIRGDVRAASGIALEGDGSQTVTTLTLTHAQPEAYAEYLFFENRVERLRLSAGDILVEDKSWPVDHATVDVDLAHGSDGEAALLHLAVQWHRRSKDDTQPGRRFDMILRAAGEHCHEPQ